MSRVHIVTDSAATIDPAIAEHLDITVLPLTVRIDGQDFEDGADPGLLGLVGMQDELSEILGRTVDLVEREAVERSENYIRRRHILSTAETVYVAR